MRYPQQVSRLLSASQTPRWLRIALGIVLFAFLALVGIVLANWPYRKSTVTQHLQTAFASKMDVAQYRLVFFPSPGFVADGLAFHRHGDEKLPPLATIARLRASGSYATILFAPGRVETLRIEGLHVQIPPAGSGTATTEDKPTKTMSRMVVSHLIADGAQLDIMTKSGEKPLHFDIRRLRLDDVGPDRAMSFSTGLIEPMMRGEVRADGKLGPIKTDDPGKIQVTATYKLAGANFNAFHDLSGTLSSSGKFGGMLEDIDIEGAIETSNFRVRQGHPINLSTRYKAVVNATDGDVSLRSVTGQFDRTTISSDGEIAGNPKLTSLNLAVDGGRIQDLLSIFVTEAPPMNGAISLKAKAFLPTSDEPFLKRLRMDGDFGIGGGRFNNPDTREKVDAFSERAREEKPKKNDPDPSPVISDVKGHAAVKDGVATFTNLLVSLPGANAILSGTFNLIDKSVHLYGDLHMDTDISHTTTGIKSILLKPLIPFFKKKNKGSIIPIQITGTFHHPVVGESLMPKGQIATRESPASSRIPHPKGNETRCRKLFPCKS